MRSLFERRLAQRGQQGLAMMAGLVIYVGLSGVALIALLNMSFTSTRIADIQQRDAQQLRAVDSALESAVTEIRNDQSHATSEPTGDSGCRQSLGQRDQPGLVYDDGLGNRVVVLSACDGSGELGSPSNVSLRAMLGPAGDEQLRGTARLDVRPTTEGQLTVVRDWSLRPDPADDPPPPPSTTTTTTSTTTPTTSTTTTVPPTADWSLTVTSDWTSGYCADVRVTNPTNARLDWVVTVPVEGTIYVFWSASYSRNGNQLTVQGASWNRTLAPGASTNFGFCSIR